MARERKSGLQPKAGGDDSPDPRGTITIDGATVEAAGAAPSDSDTAPRGTIDPSSISGTGNDSGEPKRRGGWPKGKPRGKSDSSSNQARSTSPLDANALDALIFSAHGILSAFSHIPEIALTKDESKALAEATVSLAAHYPSIARKVPPEAFAWFNFAQVTALVYGPRVAAFRMRQAQERAKARASANGAGGQGFSQAYPMGSGVPQ